MRRESIKRAPIEGRPQGSTWQLFLRCCRLFRPHRRHLGILLLLLAGASACDLLSVRLLGAMVDQMTEGDASQLTQLFVIFGATAVGSALFGFGQAYFNESIGQSVVHRLRGDLHQHVQSLPVNFFTQTRTGEVLSRITTDVNAVQGAVSGTFTELLSGLMTLSIAFFLMASLNWQMALVTFLVLPLWVYPTVRVGRRMRRLRGQWHEESARMHAQLEETLSVSGSMLVKTFGQGRRESSRFAATNERMRSLAVRRLIAGRWFNMSTSLFAAAIPGVVYWYGGRAALGSNALSIGEVVAFAMLAQRVFDPFATLARLNTTVLSSAALFERIFEYIDLPLELVEPESPVELSAPRGDVEFADVTFAYPSNPGQPAVRDVSFHARPGDLVALVGHSGAGKTSVTYLLQRFYDPTDGAVRIDGHDLRDLSLASVTASVGAVMQETYLFNASLAHNIRYGRPDANNDEVQRAVEAAGLRRLIEQLPDGLDTVVGERGFRLSGGEKQRVAIARAILKDPRVLLMDEATSALDSRLEREIQEATEILAEGRTTIVIAHRLSTVVRADLILVLDQGGIVERGTHHELLALGGAYAALHNEQLRDGPRHGELATVPVLSRD